MNGTRGTALQAELARRTAEARALADRLASSRARLAESRARARDLRARTAGVKPDYGDPLLVARRATQQMELHRTALARLADERADAIQAALAAGLSRADVARGLGVTPQAITKVLNRQFQSVT